jgi:long-chain acyl-CoA synthetase
MECQLKGTIFVEKIWLKHYPAGTPSEINPDEYESLVAMLDSSFQKFAEKPAFYNLGVTLTFKELDDYSKAFAAYLQQQLGMQPGAKIALMLPNILQYPVALFGSLRAGLTVVNINPLYTAPELIHQLNDSGATALVVLENFAATVTKAWPALSLQHVILTKIGDLLPFLKATVFNFFLKYIHKKIPEYNLPCISFKKILSEGKKLSLQRVTLKSSDIAFLQYTGGTTGVAKGAMLTHRNLITNVLQAEAWFNKDFFHEDKIIITALPLYHIFSLTANCLFFSKIGGLNVLITNPRDIKAMVKDMSRFKFTFLTGVNTLFHALTNFEKFKALDFSHLKVCLGGGMAVQRAVAMRWQEITGKPILEAYGLTETSPCVTINPPTLQEYNGTVGLPVSSTDICIFDDAFLPLGLNQPGELAIKGPQVMAGYWQNPAETAKVFTKDGWLLTGDIALVTSEGFVKILERKKDMILVSGFNVYPNELEDTLMRMPKIQEVAIVGVPDDNSGEVVKAFIVKKNPKLTTSEVIEFCRENMTGYKVPKYVEFCQELPKTNVGKISRKELRVKVSSE